MEPNNNALILQILQALNQGGQNLLPMQYPPQLQTQTPQVQNLGSQVQSTEMQSQGQGQAFAPNQFVPQHPPNSSNSQVQSIGMQSQGQGQAFAPQNPPNSSNSQVQSSVVQSQSQRSVAQIPFNSPHFNHRELAQKLRSQLQSQRQLSSLGASQNVQAALHIQIPHSNPKQHFAVHPDVLYPPRVPRAQSTHPQVQDAPNALGAAQNAQAALHIQIPQSKPKQHFAVHPDVLYPPRVPRAQSTHPQVQDAPNALRAAQNAQTALHHPDLPISPSEPKQQFSVHPDILYPPRVPRAQSTHHQVQDAQNERFFAPNAHNNAINASRFSREVNSPNFQAQSRNRTQHFGETQTQAPITFSLSPPFRAFWKEPCSFPTNEKFELSDLPNIEELKKKSLNIFRRGPGTFLERNADIMLALLMRAAPAECAPGTSTQNLEVQSSSKGKEDGTGSLDDSRAGNTDKNQY